MNERDREGEIKALMFQIDIINERLQEINGYYYEMALNSNEPVKPDWMTEEQSNRSSPLLKARAAKEVKISKMLGIETQT